MRCGPCVVTSCEVSCTHWTAPQSSDRPYTVTESVYSVREETGWPGLPEADRMPATEPIFLPFPAGSRTTQWERGNEPMTRLTVPADPDPYGLPLGQVDLAVPRFRDPRTTADPAATVEPYLATYATTEYARRDEPAIYLADRVSRATTFEIVNDGRLSATGLAAVVLTGGGAPGVSLRVIGQTQTFYDGDAFTGLALGELGDHGLPACAEALAFADAFLDDLYKPADPRAVGPRPSYLAPGQVTWTDEHPHRVPYPAPGAGRIHPPHHQRRPRVRGRLCGFRPPGTVTTSTPTPITPTGWGAGCRWSLSTPSAHPRGSDYDEHDLLPVTMTDPAGLATLAVHDCGCCNPGRSPRPTATPAWLPTPHSAWWPSTSCEARTVPNRATRPCRGPR